MTIITNRAYKVGGNGAGPARSLQPRQAFLSLAAGAALAGAAIWRRDWIGAALAGGGGYLLYSGARDLRRPYQGSVRVAVTIARERAEIYRFATDSQNWSRFLAFLQMEPREPGALELGIGKPPKFVVSSKVKITDHSPGEYVAWASDQEGFTHRGVIHFKAAPGARGTEVSVALEYRAPGGPIARSLASLAGWHPEQVVRESLRHLKQVMEAGEIPTTQGQALGARGTKGAVLRVLYRERPTEPARADTRIAGD
jgi:uncharacterized membrane protein